MLRPAMTPDETRFVLVGTSHAGNVGAAARAMKVMGFADLVLVAPRFADVLEQPEARAMASGATDVLAAARIVPTLAAALEGISYACATAMTPRDFGPPTRAPRTAFDALAASAHRVALVFGSERFGMSNDAVHRCHVCLSIPTARGYGSLNLAQAVQLLAYEWRMAQGGFPVEPRTLDPTLGDATALDATLEHWRQALVAIGYLDPAVPRKLLPRLRRLLQRAAPTVEELHILRGIARAAAPTTRKRDSAPPAESGPEWPLLTPVAPPSGEA